MATKEFSRILEVNESITDKTGVIEANINELKALADRFEVDEIKNLKAEYMITKKSDIEGAYIFSCHLTASVVKFVIEKNEELFQIDDRFDVVLLDEDMARNNYEQLKDFDIEIFDKNQQVDLGEIVAQYLSLCIFM